MLKAMVLDLKKGDGIPIGADGQLRSCRVAFSVEGALMHMEFSGMHQDQCVCSRGLGSFKPRFTRM